MIPTLVTFDLAKKHLEILDNSHDDSIDAKLRMASMIVTNHCKLTEVPDEWKVYSVDFDSFDSEDLILTDDTFTSPLSSPPDQQYYVRVPGAVQAAVLLVLGDLFENRESSTGDPVSDTVCNLLAPYRDPTIA